MHRKWPLLFLCAIAFVSLAGAVVNVFGLGSPPWYGYWDATRSAAGTPYQLSLSPRTDGAFAQAGIREGDRFDVRDNPLGIRAQMLWQPFAGAPTKLMIRRDGKPLSTIVIPTTVYDGQPLWKLPSPVLTRCAEFVLLVCALLIAIRRSNSADARSLAAIMLLWVLGATLSPSGFAMPDGSADLIQYPVSRFFGFASCCLIIHLASRFGSRSRWRDWLEWIAYALCALRLANGVATVIGVATLALDPEQLFGGFFWIVAGDLSFIAVVLTAVAAVATTEPSQRPRTAWMLLPLAVGLAGTIVLGGLSAFIRPWFGFITVLVVANVFMFTGALLVTYAVLRRRVLDVGFVLSRSIVFVFVSLIVVAAFVLLEWLLGSALAGVSHATGVAANAGLALVLGISMRFIHKRVDDFVDRIMFRKRYDDERALRDFVKEAAFVTDRDALLEQAIRNVQAHTDARSAAVFVRRNGSYENVRGFGDVENVVSENDPAILALKAWHKPLDPSGYASALGGELALPMLGRGQLLGVLLCGERAGGEAYAPDEIDALAQFAQGVGSAFDLLAAKNGSTTSPAGGEDEFLDVMRDVRQLLKSLAAPADTSS